MKKFIVFIIVALIFSPASFSDEWDTFLETDRSWDGQKSITNKEFEEAIDVIEANKKKKEAKQRKKRVKKVSGGGTSLHNELNPENDIINQKPAEDVKQDDLILNVPVNMLIGGSVLEKGYYKIIAEKDKNGDIYFMFYQSQFLKGKVKATETKDDFEQETINFVNLFPVNNSFIKVIYGSLDFNAYAYIKYSEF